MPYNYANLCIYSHKWNASENEPVYNFWNEKYFSLPFLLEFFFSFSLCRMSSSSFDTTRKTMSHCLNCLRLVYYYSYQKQMGIEPRTLKTRLDQPRVVDCVWHVPFRPESSLEHHLCSSCDTKRTPTSFIVDCQLVNFVTVRLVTWIWGVVKVFRLPTHVLVLNTNRLISSHDSMVDSLLHRRRRGLRLALSSF